MESLGMEVELREAAPGRVSAVGRLPGAGAAAGGGAAGAGRSLLWNGHLDTVGVEGMERPFAARVENGRLYARGAYDMKGALAACLAAVRALKDGGVRLAGDLMIAAVADEEDASLGTRDVLTAWRADGAIVVEPTELALALAHKGFVWLDLEVRGRAAHGSRWDLGVDANLAMGRVLAEVAGLEEELRARPPHALVGPPSLHVGVLEGGTGPSTYAARAAAQVERRTVPGETVAQVEAEIAAAIERARSAAERGGDGRPALTAGVTTRLARPAFEAHAGSPLAAAVEGAAAEVLGAPPPRVGVPFWTDAALFAEAGIDTVLIGPVGAGAHEPVEWVDLESCARLAAILARTAIAYCGTA
jgi:acetylornithine deacetylase